MPEAEIPVSPADVQRTLIARQNGATYDATAQTVTDAAPEVPANGEPVQNEATPANSEAQGDGTPTPVEGGGDEEASAEADHTEPETPETPQPGKNHVARKIDKLTRENAELQRAVQQLMQRSQVAQPQQQPQPQAPADPQPDPANYADYAQYMSDRSAWVARQQADRVVQERMAQVFGTLAQQAQQAQAVQQASQAVQEFNTRVETGAKEIKDFAQVTTAQADVEVAPHVAASIMQGVDNPAVVLYHLAKNPAEVAKLNQLPPAKVAARLGAIEANAKRAPAISNAPKPGVPVAAKGGAPTGYSDSMTPEQFMAWRSKK